MLLQCPDLVPGGTVVEEVVANMDVGPTILHAAGLRTPAYMDGRSFLDLARAVFAALERKPKIEYVDTPVEIRDRYQYFTQAEMGKLREAGFTGSATELEDGVGDYVRNYLATEDPYR